MKNRYKGVDGLMWYVVKKELKNEKCKKCGSTNNLTLHHKKKYAMYPTLRTEITNIVVLCEKCHKNIHKNEEKKKKPKNKKPKKLSAELVSRQYLNYLRKKNKPKVVTKKKIGLTPYEKRKLKEIEQK